MEQINLLNSLNLPEGRCFFIFLFKFRKLSLRSEVKEVTAALRS